MALGYFFASSSARRFSTTSPLCLLFQRKAIVLPSSEAIRLAGSTDAFSMMPAGLTSSHSCGFSAACAIANRILTEGETAVADYKKFLSAGGSMDPISILKLAGVDMTTAAPVNEALKLFGELIDEMEELMA